MKARRRIVLGTLALSINACCCVSTSLAQGGPASLATTRQTQVIVTITDTPGRYVGGLHKDQVTMLDNGVPQEVLNIEESTFPVSIGLLFNVSRSRYRDSLAVIRKTILNFFDVPQKTNEYFIMGFDEKSLLATDWTREPKELISGFDKLESMKPSKNPTAYEALGVGIKKMSDARHFKRAVIMISDLNDPGSTSKRDQVLEMLMRSDVLVYAIILDTSLLARSFLRPALERICSVSGGFAKDAKNTAEFLDLMEIISLELRHQYLISFMTRGAEGDWHRVSFEVKPLMVPRPSSKKIEKVPLFVRSREGYYSRP
jgi:VWFA-related protein